MIKPPEALTTKDKRLALEMAEAVGADTPVVRLMEELDPDSEYDGLADIMKQSG